MGLNATIPPSETSSFTSIEQGNPIGVQQREVVKARPSEPKPRNPETRGDSRRVPTRYTVNNLTLQALESAASQALLNIGKEPTDRGSQCSRLGASKWSAAQGLA